LGDAPSGNRSRDGNGALDLAVVGAATGKCGPQTTGSLARNAADLILKTVVPPDLREERVRPKLEVSKCCAVAIPNAAADQPVASRD
jgi:hypothetical protein